MFRTQPSGGVWAGSHPLTTSWFTFGTTLLCSSSHCTVWHSFARPLSSYCILEFTLQCLGHCTLHIALFSTLLPGLSLGRLSTCQMPSRTSRSRPSPEIGSLLPSLSGCEGGEIELSEILPLDLPVLGSLPQYMKPGGMSLGLRKSTLGLCLLGCDL